MREKWRRFLLAIRVGNCVIANAPKGATGIYITGRSVQYGYRTNRAKFPANFFVFSYLEPIKPFAYDPPSG